MKTPDIFHKPIPYKGVIKALIAIIFTLVVFQLGMFVGYKKAMFSYNLGDNFHRTFGTSHPERFANMLPPGGFENAHGTFGKIISIGSDTIIIEDVSGIEKNISIKPDTIIKRFRDTIHVQDLSVGTHVIIIGEPEEKSGVLDARLIRSVPPPSSEASTTVFTQTH